MKFFRGTLSSLRSKMLMMFVILTSIPLISVGIVSYQKSFVTITNHSKAANTLAANQLRRDMDNMFKDAGRLLELENNPNVRRFLSSQSETYEDAKEILKAFRLYRETYNFNKNVLNIIMVNIYGKGISERKGVFHLGYDLLKNPHLRTVFQAPEEVLYIPPNASHPVNRLDGSDYGERRVISIVSTVKHPITHQVIGFMTIVVDDAIVEYFCDNVRIGDTGYFYVVNDEGTPIFLPNRLREEELTPALVPPREKLLQGNGQYVDASGGDPQFIIFTTSEETEWSIIGQVPLAEITKDASDIRRLIFLSVALSILFTIALYFFITSRLTKPIQILKSKMRQAASGQLEAKVSTLGSDEITDLGKSFNTMLDKIKRLMEQNIREQEHIKKAELRTLQAQINPHFLYNTLDSILWMAEAKRNEQVIEIVKALSQFFRIGLNKGNDWITIKEELDHVRSYLTIQQMRYRDILRYEINAPAEILETSMLKMTLQPIVENALYHGIKNKRALGTLSIRGEKTENGDVLLHIEDDGNGMTPEKLEEVRRTMLKPLSIEELGADDADSGFGIRNVHQRLKLCYGEPYGLEVNSAFGRGTRVTLRIPDQKG